MKNKLILVRGLPGSGKTTFANVISPVVVSADMFFEHDGKYTYVPSLIGVAHTWCKDKVNSHMKNLVPILAVANTFTTQKEMQPYFDLADEHGYEVHTVIVENRHGNTNIHSVPAEVIEKMKQRFETKL